MQNSQRETEYEKVQNKTRKIWCKLLEGQELDRKKLIDVYERMVKIIYWSVKESLINKK